MGEETPLRALRAALPKGYVVEEFLEEGGQGFVCKGKRGETPVAVKVFAPDLDQRRLVRELDALRKIDCPNLVKVVDTTQVELEGGERTVVAYEYLSGGDLRKHLVAGSALSEESLCRIGVSVATAIEALWAERIVHRDIKPANIVEASDGRLVLVDIGLARHTQRSDITVAGRFAGTRGYMSPEQARGRRGLTFKADAFALGVTLYELAAKKHPYAKNQGLIGTSTPRSLKRERPDLSDRLVNLIHQMFRTKPAERPASLADTFRQIGG
jgi:serine/threonine-protein kinase